MNLTRPAKAEPLEIEEQRVLDLCRQGEVQAFGWLVQKYMKLAYFTAFGLVGNHEDALDLSQEAFVRAFRGMERFDVQQRFFTWYYKILRNLSLNHLRDHSKARRVQAAATPLEQVTIADSRPDPSREAERNELSEQLWQTLAGMKAEEREILLLREMEGCSYSEIAARLDIPTGTVMSRLFQARKRLKEKMENVL